MTRAMLLSNVVSAAETLAAATVADAQALAASGAAARGDS
jgi:hypothetical protein